MRWFGAPRNNKAIVVVHDSSRLLAKIIIIVSIVVNQRSFYDISRQGAQQRQSDCRLLGLVGHRVVPNLILAEFAKPMQSHHGLLRCEVAFRSGAKLCMNSAFDIRDHSPDFVGDLGALLFELSSDIVGCLRDQLLKNVSGNIPATPEVFSKNGIILGTLDQMQETELGETRSLVRSHRTRDLLVAAHDKYVCDGFNERPALRDGEKVLLALRVGIGDQRSSIKPLGLSQHRARNFDRIVKCKRVDHLSRCMIDGGQPLAELRASRHFDLFSEPTYHLAKDPDLIV